MTSTGRNVLQTVDFAQPLRLPLVVDPSLVSVDDSSGYVLLHCGRCCSQDAVHGNGRAQEKKMTLHRLVVTVTKPGAGGGAEVQIPIQ